jgi:hypothetical protein
MAIANSGISQSGQPVWISTGDYVSPSFLLETPERYVLGTLTSKLKPDGSYGDPFIDWGSIIIATDKSLQIQDSIFIQFIDDWYVMIFQSKLLNNGQILLTGPACHIITKEYKMGMIWLDESLNILHDTLIGIENHRIDPSGSVIINQAGKLVSWGSVLPTKGSSDEALSNEYFFIEMEQNGTILNYLVQSLEAAPYYLLPVGSDKYHSWAWNNRIVQLNSDFSYDTTYTLSLPEQIYLWRTQAYNNQSYFLLGDYSHAESGYLDIDLAVLHVDSTANVLNTFVFGFKGEMDGGTAVSYFHPDTLFVGGARKIEPFPVDSNDFNHLFVHKTTISGEIVSTAFFGINGQVNLGGLLATSDGGCIMSGTYNDFLTYPDSNIRDVFLVKMDANGTITRLDESKLQLHPQKYLVYPIPAKDHLMIRSKDSFRTRASFFNANGVLITSLDFVSNAEIDVSGFQPGVYFLQLIQQDGYSETKKLLIKN